MESGYREIFEINCPKCGLKLSENKECAGCSLKVPNLEACYIDLIPDKKTETAAHYSKQWGSEKGFLKFLQDQPASKKVLASAALGWDSIFEEIRSLATLGPVSVFDAACGFGGIANEIVNADTYGSLSYVGADIHGALSDIPPKIPLLEKCGKLLRWDISVPLPTSTQFDYVLCRASIHHTPDPSGTFSSLVKVLKPGGKIAISAYRKKSICREACDDALRAVIKKMGPDEAWEACRQFSILGESLQKIEQPVELSEDVPFLNLKKGSYSVQSLVYYHLLKCFYNEQFGMDHSTLVNFDWYHPTYAFRYDLNELESWFEREDIKIIHSQSSEVQHFIVGQMATS